MISLHTLNITFCMLIEEEPKHVGEINPDTFEAVFEEEVFVEEEVSLFSVNEDDEDEIDVAFLADDDKQW